MADGLLLHILHVILCLHPTRDTSDSILFFSSAFFLPQKYWEAIAQSAFYYQWKQYTFRAYKDFSTTLYHVYIHLLTFLWPNFIFFSPFIKSYKKISKVRKLNLKSNLIIWKHTHPQKNHMNTNTQRVCIV